MQLWRFSRAEQGKPWMPWSDPALSRPQRLRPPCVARYSEFLLFLCNIFGIFFFSEPLSSFLSQTSVLLYCETERYCILLYPSYLFLMKMFIGSPRPGTWNLLLLLKNSTPLQLLESQVYVKSGFSHGVSGRADANWSSVASFCFAFELILLNCPLTFFFFLISEKAFVLS